MLKTALFAAVATMAATTVAYSAEYNAHVGVASDYIFRGVDQSPNSELQFFGGVDATQDQFYGGAWLSNTGGKGEEALEYNLYAGFKPSYAGASFDLGVIYYGYTDSDNKVINHHQNTVEIKAAASYPVGPVTLGGAVYYAPENGLFADEATIYSELSAGYTISEGGPTFSAAVGYNAINNFVVDNYTTWNVGVTYPVNEKLSVDARVSSSNDRARALFGKDLADTSFVLTGKAAF